MISNSGCSYRDIKSGSVICTVEFVQIQTKITEKIENSLMWDVLLASTKRMNHPCASNQVMIKLLFLILLLYCLSKSRQNTQSCFIAYFRQTIDKTKHYVQFIHERVQNENEEKQGILLEEKSFDMG